MKALSKQACYNSKFQERNILKISFYVKLINDNKNIVPKTIAVWNQNSNHIVWSQNFKSEFQKKIKKLITNFILHKSYQCQ